MVKLNELIETAQLDAPLANGRTLYRHQQEAVSYLLRSKLNGLRGVMLADDMGLGKTCSALVAARALADTFPIDIVVVCPASVKENWRIEAAYVGVQIKTYSWAKIPPPSVERRYLVIFDEAHYAQGGVKTKRGREFKALIAHFNCYHAWLLTGTPMKNGAPINIYPLLEAIDHPVARNGWKFKHRYCNPQRKLIGNKYIWDFNGASNIGELSNNIVDVMLHRKKIDCLDLPAKTRITHRVSLSPTLTHQHQSEINEIVEEYYARVDAGEVSQSAAALVTLGALRRVGSKYKVDYTIQLAQDILAEGQSVVIFTEFIESAHAIYQQLGGYLLTGATSIADRQSIVSKFQSSPTPTVFVGTIKAGGVGITLTRANHLILHDRAYTPGDNNQAEDRCHRIGQTSNVSIHWVKLYQIDDILDEKLHKKNDVINVVMENKSDSITLADIAINLLSKLKK